MKLKTEAVVADTWFRAEVIEDEFDHLKITWSDNHNPATSQTIEFNMFTWDNEALSKLGKMFTHLGVLYEERLSELKKSQYQNT
jgi:hypothetical protein